MVDVCLLGTGGMMPLPGRALTSLYVRCEGRVVLIDCGEGTQTAIREAGLRFKPIESIMITHFHADHISGLPGLLLTLGNEGRMEPLEICGPVGLKRVVESLCIIAPELPFEIKIREFSGGASMSAAGLDVDAFPVDHGVLCFGYRFQRKRPGKFDPVSARERGIPVNLWSRLQRGECVDGYTPDAVLGPPRKGIRLLYATDSRPVEKMWELGADADLLILEGMYGDLQKLQRAEESHHMTMQEAAMVAAKAGAKELWLTHFSPATPEPEQYLPEVQKIFENTRVGVDGMHRVLNFPEA